MASSSGAAKSKPLPIAPPIFPLPPRKVIADGPDLLTRDTLPEGIDLDSIVSRLGNDARPPIAQFPPVVLPRKRPSWLAAIAIATTVMVVGLSAALVVVLTHAEAKPSGVAPPVMVPKPRPSEPAPAPEPAVLDPMMVQPHSDGVERATAVRIERANISFAPPRERPHETETNVVEASAETAEADPIEEEDTEVETTAETTLVETTALEAVSAEDLPEQPSRDAVQSALRDVSGEVAACAPGTGNTTLEVRFASSGRVAEARVDSSGATPEQRSCMARAARAAHVPPFARPSLTVRFPLQL